MLRRAWLSWPGWRNFGGLWLILIGWFLASAAGAEGSAARIKDVMAGVRVSDIMTPEPDIGPAWSTAGDFIERVARQSRQRVFPVLEFRRHSCRCRIT